MSNQAVVDNLNLKIHITESLPNFAEFTVVEAATPQQQLRTIYICLLYTSPSPRDLSTSRMPSSA